MRQFICNILVWIRKHLSNEKICRYLEKKIAKLDGGYYYSTVIRKLYVELHGLSVGYGTYGGCWNNSSMWWNNITIGNYCSFAGNVSCFPCNHPLHLFTTHPITYDTWSSGANIQRIFNDVLPSLQIGHGVWIGNGVIITSRCKKVGNGAVIGAGSVVTHDVPPYAIVVGNPAKVLRYRLSSEQIERVEASKWWLLNKDELNYKMDELLKLTLNDN